jgi:chromosome segregation ATPase
MIKLSIFTIFFISSFFQVIAQTLSQPNDSLKKEAYIAYVEAKEKEIISNKNERVLLEKSLIETDSLLSISKSETVEIEAKKKSIRLDINTVGTGVKTHQDALLYNKNRTGTVNQLKLDSKKSIDLSKMKRSEAQRNLEELEANVTRNQERIQKNAIALKEKEDEVEQLDIELKKRGNLVEVNTSTVSSLTVSLDDASQRQESLKIAIEANENRLNDINSELISAQSALELTENKIGENKKKLEINIENEHSWIKELKKVQQQIKGLEDSRITKKRELDKLPDSLKTSDVLISTQEEVRMINDHLKKLKEEETQLEKDIAQLKEVSHVIDSDNEKLINERNIQQSALRTIREDKVKQEEKLKEERSELQVLNVKTHDLSSEKEQVYRTLQKAENEFKYYTEESFKRTGEVVLEQTEQSELKKKVDITEAKRDSVKLYSNELTEELNVLISQNKTEIAELKKLKIQKESLSIDLDSLLLSSKKLVNDRKVVDEELELLNEKTKTQESNKKTIVSRIAELTNDTDDEVLKSIDQAKKGQFDNVFATLREVLEKDKTNATSHTLMGYTHYIQGDLAQAEIAYTEAINDSPQVVEPYILRAEVREDSYNYNGALKDYNQVVYLDPSKGEAYYKQGVLLYYFLNEQEKGCESWMYAFKLGVKEANEKIIEHCAESTEPRFYVITQLTKRATKDSYGFDESNPIKVGKNKERQDYNVVLYLQLLQDKQGKPVKFVRYGTCCRYTTENGLKEEGLLERYRITFKDERGKSVEKTLYFTYYDFEKPRVPKGLETNHEIY